MLNRRFVVTGLAITGLFGVTTAQAQFPPPIYEGERRYRDGVDEEEEHRRFEERRRQGEERRNAYYEQRGRPQTVIGLEQERNRRVLGLQQELSRGQIGRREFNERVAQIDFELHSRLGQ